MKPTQVKCSEGSINQLPPWTEVQGDIRLTPFYNIDECIEKVRGYIQELNAGRYTFSVVCVSVMIAFYSCICIDLSLLPTRGPCSKYDISIAEGNFRGQLELSFESEPMRVSNMYLCLLQIICVTCCVLPFHMATHGFIVAV